MNINIVLSTFPNIYVIKFCVHESKFETGLCLFCLLVTDMSLGNNIVNFNCGTCSIGQGLNKFWISTICKELLF